MAITKDIKTAKSTQEIANLGFDTEFNLPVVENLVYNPTTSGIERMVQPGQELPTSGANPSIEYDFSDPSSIVITKTIGTDNYQQTITLCDTVAIEGVWTKL